MQKEIIVNSSPNEVRVALLEDREVVEFSMERAESRRAVGNVYKGVVTAVRPGLQAAFVEIGMEKAGFLHVSDLIHDDPDDDDDGGGRGGRRRRRGRREGLRPIESMLKEGDELLVQVTKEIIGTKGPRLTADISLPGRFMVLMPKGDHVGVSRKIEDRKERHRLRDLLSGMKPDDEGGAFIIRTAAVGVEPRMLQRDMEYLRNLWKEIQAGAHSTSAPAVVHQDVGLLVGMIRDIFKDDIDALVVDSRDEYNELVQHIRNFSPELRERIHFYEGDVPIFDKYGVESELKKSLERKVWMKRGGFLVIDEAEALVAIDVNTGRYTGRKNQAETIFKTNMLAAREIARQLRLRDIGGIIVCDFIDMDSEDDKRKVLNELRTHLKRDRARTKTFPVTDLGLVEMSRQRVQQSLKDRLSDDCPYCGGGGQVLSTDTLANKVERLILKLAATREEKAIQVRANPTLALVLMTDRANGLQNIARSTGIRIDVVDDPRLHREQFQIVSLHRRKDLVAEIEKAATERRDTGDGAAEQRRRGARDEDSGGRRRRRRREDEGESTEQRPSRRSSSRGDDRPAREEPRRRSRSGQEARDGSGAAATAEKTATREAEKSERHPAAEGDGEGGTRRRRRRRGRRGGRGRRRRGSGDDEAATANAGADSQRNERPAREDSRAERRERAPREEKAAPADDARKADSAPADREREQQDSPRQTGAESAPPRQREESTAPKEVAAEPVPDDQEQSDERRSRRRRRRRGKRGASSAPEPSTQRREASAAEETSAAGSRASAAAGGSEDDAGDDAPSRSRRARRRPEEARARSEQGRRKDGPDRESYVRPVPEEEWMRQRAEKEAATAPAEEKPAAPKPETDRDRPRRRRRRRQAGTPTRLIGTGKTGAQDD